MLEKAFKINQEEQFAIIQFFDYCSNESLDGLLEHIGITCDAGTTQFMLDFSNCQIVNSLGIATLLEGLLIIKDYEGTAIIFGLDPIKKRFFSLTGVFSLAELVENYTEAFEHLKR